MSFQISLTNNDSTIIREYRPSIFLKQPYEMCLKSFTTYNSIPNISPQNHNNEIMLYDRVTSTKYRFVIPTGTYELEDLITCITSNVMLDPAEIVMYVINEVKIVL